MNTRDKLEGILTPEEVEWFKHGASLPSEMMKQKERLKKIFWFMLMNIIASHHSEQLLMIRRRYVVSYGVESLQSHFYLGLISSQIKEQVLISDGIALPTARYVDRLNSSHCISRSNGCIPESILGADAVWLFFSRFDGEQYALDFFIGDEEVDAWFTHPSRVGRTPYLRQDLLSALGYPAKVNENLPLQFAPA